LEQSKPGSHADILDFVKQYGVTFDLFSKIEVNGQGAEKLYQYLKNCQQGSLGSLIRWNFQKFLCNKKGVPVKRYEPNISPDTILKDILELLDE